MKTNPNVINVNEGIMVYLNKIHKKKFNQVLLLLLSQINILKKDGQDLITMRKLKIFLSKFAFKNLNLLTKLDDEIIFRKI